MLTFVWYIFQDQGKHKKIAFLIYKIDGDQILLDWPRENSN